MPAVAAHFAAMVGASWRQIPTVSSLGAYGRLSRSKAMARQADRIQDHVLAVLKEKGASGASAADIRSLLESQGVHMYRASASVALYRLSLLNLARRKGQMWFALD